MLRPYNLLENVLIDIEEDIKKDINSGILADKYSISEGHMRRLFKFAFKQNIAGYIRSRRLTASLDALLNTDLNILNIALNSGYDYEQTYIRAFRDEFGISPGKLRKTGQIVKVKPPLHLFDENKLEDNILFGPDIVMVPKFFIAGISHNIPYDKSVTSAPKAAIHFWENERKHIKNSKNHNIYIGLTCNNNFEAGYSEYITSVIVNDINHIPAGFRGYTFESCLCARFRYIGQHHYYDINRKIACEMYKRISKFAGNNDEKFSLLNDKVYFEKIDIDSYDGNYCQMEWFTPVARKY